MEQTSTTESEPEDSPRVVSQGPTDDLPRQTVPVVGGEECIGSGRLPRGNVFGRPGPLTNGDFGGIRVVKMMVRDSLLTLTV